MPPNNLQVLNIGLWWVPLSIWNSPVSIYHVGFVPFQSIPNIMKKVIILNLLKLIIYSHVQKPLIKSSLPHMASEGLVYPPSLTSLISLPPFFSLSLMLQLRGPTGCPQTHSHLFPVGNPLLFLSHRPSLKTQLKFHLLKNELPDSSSLIPLTPTQQSTL